MKEEWKGFESDLQIQALIKQHEELSRDQERIPNPVADPAHAVAKVQIRRELIELETEIGRAIELKRASRSSNIRSWITIGFSLVGSILTVISVNIAYKTAKLSAAQLKPYLSTEVSITNVGTSAHKALQLAIVFKNIGKSAASDVKARTFIGTPVDGAKKYVLTPIAVGVSGGWYELSDDLPEGGDPKVFTSILPANIYESMEGRLIVTGFSYKYPALMGEPIQQWSFVRLGLFNGQLMPGAVSKEEATYLKELVSEAPN